MSVEQVCSRTEDEIALSEGDDGMLEEEVGGDNALSQTEDMDDEDGDGGDNASSNKVFEVMELAAAASDSFSLGHAPGILYSWYSGLRPDLG
jgi:hypothetical protein